MPKLSLFSKRTIRSTKRITGLYTIDEADDQDKNDSKSDILKKLHQAAADRKRKSLSLIEPVQQSTENSVESTKSPAKRARISQGIDASPSKQANRKPDQEHTPSKSKQDVQNSDHTPQSSKKQKRKRKSNQGPGEISAAAPPCSIQGEVGDPELASASQTAPEPVRDSPTLETKLKLEKEQNINETPIPKNQQRQGKKNKTTKPSLSEDKSVNNDDDNEDKLVTMDTSGTMDTEDVEEADKGTAAEEGVDEEDKEDGDGRQSHQSVGGFTVIGDVRQQKLTKVQRMLPEWLAHPSVIKNDLQNNRTPLEDVQGLDADLLDKLRQNGIVDFFPGSGKTLAYVLPIIQALRERVVPQVRALVVLPVRDLALQVYKVFLTYCSGTKLNVCVFRGNRPMPMEQAMIVKKGLRGYHSNADILISTPGRLVEHINTTPGFTLKHLRFLVIDEADRMMDEIKHDWLSHVESAVYSSNVQQASSHQTASRNVDTYGDIDRRTPGPITAHNMSKPVIPLQKLLFSATLSQNPEKLQLLNLFQPKLFTSVVGRKQQVEPPTGAKADNEAKDDTFQNQGEFVGKYTTPEGLTELYTSTSPGSKPLLMIYFIKHLQFRHILCFTNSLETTHRLYWLIKLTCKNIKVCEFSSRLTASMRNKMLKKFANGKIDVVICSDSMARGMDIENVEYVVCYDTPSYLKTYIHRVGRTARAAKTGTAVSLLERKEIPHFNKMLKDAGKTGVKPLKVDTDDLEPYIEDYQKSLKELQNILKNESRR